MCLPQCLHALTRKHEEIVCTTYVFRNGYCEATCASVCTAVMAGSFLVCCLTAANRRTVRRIAYGVEHVDCSLN